MIACIVLFSWCSHVVRVNYKTNNICLWESGLASHQSFFRHMVSRETSCSFACEEIDHAKICYNWYCDRAILVVIIILWNLYVVVVLAMPQHCQIWLLLSAFSWVKENLLCEHRSSPLLCSRCWTLPAQVPCQNTNRLDKKYAFRRTIGFCLISLYSLTTVCMHMNNQYDWECS